MKQNIIQRNYRVSWSDVLKNTILALCFPFSIVFGFHQWSLLPTVSQVNVDICFSFRLSKIVVSDLRFLVDSFVGASCFKRLNWTFCVLVLNLRDIEVIRFSSSCRQTETVFSTWASPITSELALIQIIPCCRTRQTKSLFRRTLYVEGSSMHSFFAYVTAACMSDWLALDFHPSGVSRSIFTMSKITYWAYDLALWLPLASKVFTSKPTGEHLCRNILCNGLIWYFYISLNMDHIIPLLMLYPSTFLDLAGFRGLFID